MMNPVPWLQMTNMISYQGLVRTFPRESGLSPGTLSNALTRPWPKGEMIIAKAIGISPEEIWPSRFIDYSGCTIIRRIRKN